LVQASTTLPLENPFKQARREQWWSSGAALIIALLLHIGLLVVVPDKFLMSSAALDVQDEPLEIILLPPEPLTADELKFVEANPEVPENEPDRKDQYSFRAQQASDQSLKEALLDAPNVDGEENSQKIIQGAMEPAPPLAPGIYVRAVQLGEGEGTDGGKTGAQAVQMVLPAEPLPAPDFIQQKPIIVDGPGSRLEMLGAGKEVVEAPDPEAPINLYKPQPQTTQQPQQQEGNGSGGAPDAKPVPRARPTLSPDLIHGPVMLSEGSASRRGALAIDATFSEFGEYQQQFYAALQAGWYQEIEFFQPIDTSTRVVVSFRITADGVIHDVEVLHTTATEIATLICQTALTKRSPFRPWTKEMVKVFGQERTLEVVFHYR
jgi:hypothetical protein